MEVLVSCMRVRKPADAKSKTYGDADPALTYAITAGNLVNGDTFSGSLSRASGEDVGPHSLNHSSVVLSGNYALTYHGADLTITARGVEITADAKSKTYGDADPALTYAITAGNLVNGDTFSGSLSPASDDDLRPHAIDQGSVDMSGNYALTYHVADLTISARDLQIPPAAQSQPYADADPALTYAITAGNLVNGDTF